MKRILTILLTINCSLLTIHCYAQLQGPALMDSLLRELPKQKDDTNKVDLLRQLGEMYTWQNPDEGIKLGTEALKLATELSWKIGIAKANFLMCNSIYGKSDYPKALEYGLKALKQFEALNKQSLVAATLHTIGNVYYSAGSSANALEYYSKSLKLKDSLGEKRGSLSTLGNLGNVYLAMGQADRALEYQLRTLKMAEELHSDRLIPNTLSNIGHTYQNMSPPNLPMAISYYFKALKVVKDSLVKATIWGNIGDCYLALVLQDSLNLIKPNEIIPATRNERLKNAIKYMEQAIAVEANVGDLEAQTFYYNRIAIANELLGDYKNAHITYKRYIDGKDSLYSVSNAKKMIEQQMKFDYDKKETIAKAAQEKKDIIQKNIRYSIMSGMAGLIVFLVVVTRQRNKVKKQKAIVEVEKARSEELLLNILPAEVAEELKAKGSAEAKLIDEVTVLFTDFKGFTQLSEKLSPKELVSEINTCFSAFDNIMQKHGVEKIKTIGDAYMAAGGLPTPNKTHAMDVVTAALEIQDFMRRHKEEREAAGKLFFEIRIGVHTGPVVAGIVGIKKFAYDIWGDTVNTASRMESSGSVGMVNISETTYNLVKDKFPCEYRGEVEAKGKGVMRMYFVS